MSEPRTAVREPLPPGPVKDAQAALVRAIWRYAVDATSGVTFGGPLNDAIRDYRLAIEQEAASLDVERLARAIAGEDYGDLDAKDEWWVSPRDFARDIAREYEKLRTPEGKA